MLVAPWTRTTTPCWRGPRGARALGLALVETGLPPALAHAADAERYDAALAANTEQAARRVGAAVGAPVLHVDDAGIFGPVITSVPRGADALAMFDAVRHLVNQPGFYELKREITDRLIFT